MSAYVLNLCLVSLVSAKGIYESVNDEQPLRETNKQFLELLAENYDGRINQTYWDSYNGGGLSWSNHDYDWDWEWNQEPNVDKPLMFALANLTADGGVRTAHWHDNADEYTIVLQGQARVSVTKLPANFSEESTTRDRQIKSIPGTMRETETFLLNPGDAFYIPRGYSHFFESVDPEDYLLCLAAFNTGKLGTFDTPQVMANFDPKILARTFNMVDADSYEALQLYNGSRTAIDTPHANFTNNPDDITPEEYEYLITGFFDSENMVPHARDNGTRTTIKPQNMVDNFYIAYTEVAPGSWIEPYWVDNGSEYAYVLESSDSNVTMTIADQKRDDSSKSDEFELKTGLLAMCKIGYTCTIQNDSDETLKLIRFYNVRDPSITQLYDSVVGINKDTLASMFYTDTSTIEELLQN